MLVSAKDVRSSYPLTAYIRCMLQRTRYLLMGQLGSVNNDDIDPRATIHSSTASRCFLADRQPHVQKEVSLTGPQQYLDAQSICTLT